jgi:hypothetical protein
MASAVLVIATKLNSAGFTAAGSGFSGRTGSVAQKRKKITKEIKLVNYMLF